MRLKSLLVFGLVVATTTLVAQRRQRAPDALPNTPYDGKFTFVRIRYTPGGMGGEGGFGFGDPRWNHDYPRAEGHFGKILSELSLVPTYLGGGNVLTFDDPELFKFPIAYLTEPGFWSVTPKEIAGMRAWLAKGGFLIFDDFVGNHWYNFEAQFKTVLPDARLVKLDASHPIFDSFFRIESLDFYHPFQGARSEFFGVFEDNDPNGRLMIVVNYNNDMAEYWEWSDTDFAPIELTNEAYKLGINYIVYAMTH